jgi:dipeptidyl aminopeptidase/acylaminoacyl peptidase
MRRLSFLWLGLTWLGLVQTSSAAPEKVLEPRDLFSLSAAADPRFRPDGAVLAYVRVSNDIMIDRARHAIWLIDTRTGEQTPLGTDDTDATAPRWSPDGRRLAYVLTPAGGRPEVHVRWMASGQTERVARLPRAPDSLAWSPDSRRVAFVMLEPAAAPMLGAPLAKPAGAAWAEPLKVIDQSNYRADGQGELEPGRHHVYVVSADGGAPRQVTFGDGEDAGPLSWTADGRGILFTGRRDEDWQAQAFRSAIYRVDVEGGALTRLTHQQGPDASANLSPDGGKIAFIGYDDRDRGYENSRVYVMDVDGGHVHPLALALDRGLGAPHWSGDGKAVYADYVDHGVTKVARLGLDGTITDVASGLAAASLDLPYAGGDFAVARDGSVAITAGSSDHPADIVVMRQGQPRRLTDLNAELFAGKTLARIEPLTVRSPFDGLPIDAWMAKPPSFDPAKTYPLILEIHGGPFASYGPVFSTDDQLYAAAGYVVVYANPRGSTSSGAAFANEIDRAYPGHDYDDLMGVVDAVVAKGFVDPKRLFVTGGSGGGVLTSWIVGKTHRFAAAATQKPVVNWSSEVLTSDLYGWMARYWFGKLPWEDPQGYWTRSPLSLMGAVTTPTLVVVGDQDLRTPDGEAEQYFDALRLRGVPTALVRVPGAFHDMAARPSQSAAKASAILAWFARYDVGAASR